MIEVVIGGEQLPTVALGHRTKQEIDRGPGSATASACIAHAGRFLVVRCFDRYVIVQTKCVTQPEELGVLTDTREQFLADGADHLRLAVSN